MNAYFLIGLLGIAVLLCLLLEYDPSDDGAPPGFGGA